MTLLSELFKIKRGTFNLKRDQLEEVSFHLVILEYCFKLDLLEIAISRGLNILQAILRKALIDRVPDL